MFTLGFAHQVIGSAAAGQPMVVGELVRWNASLIATHPAAYDTLFAAVQLMLGVGLFIPRLVRPTLVASVLWAAGVWCLGEGFGGIFVGGASLLNGAPGAALLYGLLSVAAWPQSHLDDERPASPPAWTAQAWACLWVGFAVLAAIPANPLRAISGPIAANVSMVPTPLAAVDRIAESGIHGLGVFAVPLFIGVTAGVGLLSLGRGRYRRIAVWTGCALAFVAWVVGQSLGQLGSGQATDPNAGPLIVLLGLVVLGASRHRPEGRNNEALLVKIDSVSTLVSV
jgi:hypothetical protein